MTDPFVTYWKRQQAIRRRQNQRLTQAAWHNLDRIVQTLRESYGVQQVILLKPDLGR